MASILRISSSKNILQHLDSTVHQFQEVVIFSDGVASQFNLGLVLSGVTQLGRNVGITSLPPVISKVLWVVLDEQ